MAFTLAAVGAAVDALEAKLGIITDGPGGSREALLSDAAGQSIWRALQAADIPNLAQSQITDLVSDLAAKAALSHAHSAADLTSGTVPDARFPSTLPALNGSLLTNLNASNLASGTVPLGRLSGITTSELSAAAGIVSAQLAGAIDAAKIADGSVSNAEFQRLDGVTSGIQGQLDLKAPLASPQFSGGVGIGVAAESGSSLHLKRSGFSTYFVVEGGNGAGNSEAGLVLRPTGAWSSGLEFGRAGGSDSNGLYFYSHVAATTVFYLSGNGNAGFGDTGPTERISITNGGNIKVGTSTGTKIGTATGQKLGFWNATPVVQQVLATGAGATVDNVISLLQTLGLCKQS